LKSSAASGISSRTAICYFLSDGSFSFASEPAFEQSEGMAIKISRFEKNKYWFFIAKKAFSFDKIVAGR
jgi:hypothetical protein